MRAYSRVVVSVADFDAALAFWVDRLGMELRGRLQGDDPQLARAWGLAADAIADQALLATPGMRDGGLHLVRFRTPGDAVRDGAASTDLVLKSIDIAAHDLPRRYAELTSAGHRFRSPIGRLVTPSGLVVHEAHLPFADGLNLVLVEQEGVPEPVSPQGYGVAPQVVITTNDNARETAFFRHLLGLDDLSHNIFAGPEVERTIGLPPGASLDITILGDRASPFGRLEFVQYGGANGRNLYPRTLPPARGLLRVSYAVTDFDAVLARGRAAGIRDLGRIECILGSTRMAHAVSPMGLHIDLLEKEGAV